MKCLWSMAQTIPLTLEVWAFHTTWAETSVFVLLLSSFEVFTWRLLNFRTCCTVSLLYVSVITPCSKIRVINYSTFFHRENSSGYASKSSVLTSCAGECHISIDSAVMPVGQATLLFRSSVNAYRRLLLDRWHNGIRGGAQGLVLRSDRINICSGRWLWAMFRYHPRRALNVSQIFAKGKPHRPQSPLYSAYPFLT